MLILIIGAFIYVFYRLYNLIEQPILRIVIMALFSLGLISFFVSFIFRNTMPYSLGEILYPFGMSYIIFFLYIFLSFLILDIIKFLPFISKNILYHNNITAIVLGVVLAIILVGGYINYRIKKRSEINITINKPLKERKKLKVLALSDLHLGYGIDKKDFYSYLPLIEKEKADIILICGDIIDNSLSPLIKKDFHLDLQKLKAPLGVYAVLGNHDFFANPDSSSAFLRKSGFTLLRDTAIKVDNSFYIVGRDDRFNLKRKDLEEIVKDVDKELPIILLDHQPYNLELAQKNGIDLQISGHTHNGQVFPLNLLTKFMYELSYGYKKKGSTHYYVSSGIGLWGGKFRVLTRSEYVVINILFE